MCSHHVGDATDSLRIQHDDLCGHMSLHSLRHVLHGTVDSWVFDLEPVVCIPAYQEPHILLPIELLLEHLQQGGILRVGRGGGEGIINKHEETCRQIITELKVSEYLVRFSLLGLIEQEKGTNLTKHLSGFSLIKEPHDDPRILTLCQNMKTKQNIAYLHLQQQYNFTKAQLDVAAHHAKVPAA